MKWLLGKVRTRVFVFSCGGIFGGQAMLTLVDKFMILDPITMICHNDLLSESEARLASALKPKGMRSVMTRENSIFHNTNESSLIA